MRLYFLSNNLFLLTVNLYISWTSLFSLNLKTITGLVIMSLRISLTMSPPGGSPIMESSSLVSQVHSDGWMVTAYGGRNNSAEMRHWMTLCS